MVAPMLGGGHGWLQGRYGLMADNLVSARLVVANGSVLTVSATENEDLFWALRGAGHNFGIVASFEYKIYDRTPENENWSFEFLIFRKDKFDQVYEWANQVTGKEMPVESVHFSMWSKNPDIDPDNLVIAVIVLYQGESVPLEYIKPLLDLPPAARNTGTTDLPGLAPVAGFSATDFASQHGKAWLRFPAAMKKYDIPALRRVYNIFQSLPPHLAANSSMITEGYSVHGVQSVPKDSTAYPDRENNLLLSPFIVYDPDPAVDDKARAAGKQMQSILAEASGSGLCSYVNYAFGDEGTEAWYGREEWRLEKLRKLKHLWDPERKFGWYCPID